MRLCVCVKTSYNSAYYYEPVTSCSGMIFQVALDSIEDHSRAQDQPPTGECRGMLRCTSSKNRDRERTKVLFRGLNHGG